MVYLTKNEYNKRKIIIENMKQSKVASLLVRGWKNTSIADPSHGGRGMSSNLAPKHHRLPFGDVVDFRGLLKHRCKHTCHTAISQSKFVKQVTPNTWTWLRERELLHFTLRHRHIFSWFAMSFLSTSFPTFTFSSCFDSLAPIRSKHLEFHFVFFYFLNFYYRIIGYCAENKLYSI